MMKIVELVEPKEYYKWQYEQEIKEAQQEFMDGKGVSNEEATKIIKK
jgi:hypothetical protein